MTIHKHVMLVEDDLAMRSVLKTLLELEGYSVTILKEDKDLSGIIFEIQKANPDILFLDVHLHEVNGIDIVRGLRTDDPPYPNRILMSSGMDMKDICRGAGADDFLLKPFMPDELLNKIARLQE